MNKLIIFTAPSGAGKTTIVRHLLKTFPEQLAFSISACTRTQRYGEVNGLDYYFLSVQDFKKKVEAGDFLEWQEVYENQYYGTLHSEIQRLWNLQKTVVFDIDVKGALNIKKAYPQALSVFVAPPSQKALVQRLKNRKTEDKASLRKRIKRAKMELTHRGDFDSVLVNDELDLALQEAERLVQDFLA